MVEASPRLFRTKGWVEPRDVPTSPRRIGGFWRRWPFGRWPFGRWPARRACRVSAGGLALVDEVVPSLADSGRLAARRGLKQSRRETAAVSQARDDLIDQRETARAYTASAPGGLAPERPSPPETADPPG